MSSTWLALAVQNMCSKVHVILGVFEHLFLFKISSRTCLGCCSVQAGGTCGVGSVVSMPKTSEAPASIALLWICGAPTGAQTKTQSLYIKNVYSQTPDRPPHGAATRNDNLREFGLQTIRHLCPCVRCSLALPAVFRQGPPGFHVAQTLRFPRFIACPPARFAFGAFLCKIDAPTAVGDACMLQTTCFLDWIGP